MLREDPMAETSQELRFRRLSLLGGGSGGLGAATEPAGRGAGMGGSLESGCG